MDPASFPDIPPGLVERLEELFPDRSPTLAMSIDQIREAHGAVLVVRLLRRVFEAQNETIIQPQE
jgi:hypothetical protein